MKEIKSETKSKSTSTTKSKSTSTTISTTIFQTTSKSRADKVELLAPAGSLEKLKMAIIYGADAVYIGGKNFSLRSGAQNFDKDEMLKGIEFAKERSKKVYLTLNIIPHNDDIEEMGAYIRDIRDVGLDAVIVADPGVFSLVREIAPEMDVHISTQASNTNYLSVEFWAKQGAKRVVLARELSLEQISQIHKRVDGKVELEAFVHGAMCISYSGRCLLSTYLAGRDSNKGACAHPCRWNYSIVEEKRPNEYLPVFEDERGTYIFNSKDLCMLPYLPDMIKSGIKSLKIEGRMKSEYYVATVVSAYRKALDMYYEDPQKYVFDDKLLEEVSKASHREYYTGFYFNKPEGEDRIFGTSSYIRSYDFIGVVLQYDKALKVAKIEQRNKMTKGEEIEVLNPDGNYFVQKIEWLKNADGEPIESAPHPQMTVFMPMEKEVFPQSVLRRKE